MPKGSAALVNAEVEWRVAMATALSAEDEPDLVGFGVLPGDGWQRIKESPANSTLGAEKPLLGSVPEDTVLEQVDSNLAVLESSLKTFRSAKVDVLPLYGPDGPENSFAVSVVIDAQLPSALTKADAAAFLGNMLLGPRAGVVGGDSDLIEGFATSLIDDGEPIASLFYTSRAGYGQSLVFDDRVTAGLFPDLRFPILTNGPAVVPALSSAVMGVPAG